MENLNRESSSNSGALPIKVVQFGEGNFLRAFVDYAIKILNDTVGFNAGVALVQPIENGMVSVLNEQDGLYTLFTKGIKKGKEVQEKMLIDTIVKGVNPYVNFEEFLELAREKDLEFVISNTTEAGIRYDGKDLFDMTPPSSFPGKLTCLLYERFHYFDGNQDFGLTIIPCELINYNADTLKKVILQYIDLWKLSGLFKNWVLNACTFHNTLVDRIVPGYPKDDIEEYNRQLEYHDRLIVTAETFFLWVIEGDDNLKKRLPFHKTPLDVRIVEDMQPFRTRKVRILNGAHTAMVPMALLYGNETVKETVDDVFTGEFIRSLILEEVFPTLAMDKQELEVFAEEVFDRFRNPFIKHQLSSIALNSISKFKVRVLPSLLEYVEMKGKLPLRTVFAFACLVRFYQGHWQGNEMPLNDDEAIINTFKNRWQLPLEKMVNELLGNTTFWDTDLNQVDGLPLAMEGALRFLETHGVEKGYQEFEEGYK
ncbi:MULTISPECIES: tagaturonate reductase [Maribacter]|uniref:Tagaturonate reductase n=1 Tax=Maribacter flavus TaxID=1658664 RepID=A0ABU7IDS9_9FLAO|nr:MULTISPECIES: tagaturonate reductase [Maribacter]MDC6403954.1 tagaturonate reductase [Maribacter sp. PR66]MEE1971095.1 tagaturonate reductase [Maribacter flavus]